MGRLRATSVRLDDSGAAVVEFLALTLVVLVPLIYVVTAVAQVQAATYAAEGASRAAARNAVVAGLDALDAGDDHPEAAANERAQAAVAMTFEDFSVHGEPQLALSCATDDCFEPGGEITAAVVVEVPLPLVPAGLASVLPLSIEVSAVSRSPVDGVVVP